MKLAIIKIPEITLPGGNIFNTIHGYWIPPQYVMCYWISGCIVEYINDSIYETIKKEIIKSILDCQSIFYKENVL